MLNKKRAFTFAELMISLVIIGVITLIMYPTVSELTPNNNKYLFKETYQTITMIVSDFINSANQTTMPTNSGILCEVFCQSLNANTINPGPTCSYVNPTTQQDEGCTTFTTSNGMRWAFSYNDDRKTGYVLVDVNVSNNNTTGEVDKYDREPDTNPTPNHTYNAPKGSPNINTVWNNSINGVFYTDDTTTCDTFLFSIDSNGRVSPFGGVAATHLQNDD